MRQVARECWRVLRDDGVMFWNIADSYANQPAGNRTPSGISQNRAAVETLAQFGDNRRGTLAPGLKPKDRCGIPERTALAFQADGWYWRSGITWVKPNPMPESVTDRCTKSTEMIYMFSKNERYYYDTEAVREPNLMSSWSAKADFEGTSKRGMGGIRIEGQKGLDHPGNHELKNSYNPAGRNLRDAWTIATAPYPGQHFATFPPELPRRCIKAGTSERGCCPKCGKPWERIIEKGFTRPSNEQRIAEMIAKGVPRQKANLYTDNGPELARRKAENPDKLLGWRAACACDAGEPVPCIVLDPFSGAGTTILVARELGRHGIGLELSGEYLQQSRDRLGLTALDAWAGGNGRKHETDLTSLPLFGGSDT
jgi:DNA modification methylase